MRVAVAGTGTEIGKTHIGCALAMHLKPSALALKPIESGGTADAEALSAACGVDHRPLYAFPDPISPHLCAKRAGEPIVIERIVAWVDEHRSRATAEHVLIETAGGLYSPLGPSIVNADLARALKPDVLLVVAPDRLGVLHDVSATLRAWGEGGPRVVLALSAPEVADASTTTNADELAALGIADVAAVFVRAPLDSPETQRAAARLAAAITSTGSTSS